MASRARFRLLDYLAWSLLWRGLRRARRGSHRARGRRAGTPYVAGQPGARGYRAGLRLGRALRKLT